MPLISDPENIQYIVQNSGLKPVIALLTSSNTDILSDAITTLLNLYNTETHSEINTANVKQVISEVQQSQDKRLANLATIFLQDVCKSSNAT